MIIMMAVGIPMYVCASASTPIAASLIMKGISPGAALIFLMAGPATNIATMTVLGNTLGRRTLLMYLISIIGGALVFGLLIDLLLPAEWFYNSIMFHSEAHQHILPEWVRYGSSILLVILILNGMLRKIYSGRRKNNADNLNENNNGMNSKIKITVKGMTCTHCEASVEKGLSRIEGINKAKADHASGSVIIEGENIDLQALKSKIEALGYKYGGTSTF
jgi:copper chaperone CopZ